MGFFANASDFIVEGNQPPPNVPQLMNEVANIVQNATSGLSSGYHFNGVVQRMDTNASRYLEEELSRKDAALRAMKERRAQKAEAARIASAKHPSVGYSGSQNMGNGGVQTMAPSQMPLGFLPSVGPQQVMNAMMLPGNHDRELDSYPLNASCVQDAHSVQRASEYHTSAAYPPLYVQQHHHYSQDVAPTELGEEEVDEQCPPAANDWNNRYRPARREN